MNASTRAYLDRLFAEAGWVELRHQRDPTDRHWPTTWHQDADSLLVEAHRRSDVGNLFTTLNHFPVCPGSAARDADVDRFIRLLFDFDPVKPKHLSATDKESVATHERALELQKYLLGHGWPIPAIGLSGNGHHAQFRTALPNTPETREQLRVIYSALAARFGDDVVEFDKSVRSPGQIAPLYGSFKRKGPNTADRPHRQSEIWLPQDWRQVHPRQIEQLANSFARTQAEVHRPPTQKLRSGAIASGSGDYATLDVVRWFAAHDAYIRPIEDNKHAVRCPWSEQHSTPSPANGGDTIIYESDGGWPGFFCHHNHCEGRNIGDVLALWDDADAFCTRTFSREDRDA